MSDNTSEHELSVTIQNKLGLHTRAATLFVQLASSFPCDVYIAKDGQIVPATIPVASHVQLARLPRAMRIPPRRAVPRPTPVATALKTTTVRTSVGCAKRAMPAIPSPPAVKSAALKASRPIPRR